MTSAARKARREAARQASAAADAEAVNDASSVSDSYQNLQARLGVRADNLSAGGHYTLNPLTRKRVELDYMYRGSWVIGVGVDAPADDMTRAGIEIQSGLGPDEIEALNNGFDHLEIWQQLADGIRWGRLYGGAIVVMLIDGQDYETPLRIDTIGPGQFKGLLALDRWQLYPTYLDLVDEPGPHFGKPKWYNVVADATILNGGFSSPLLGKRIHYSRVFRFEGHKLPFYQRMAEQGWGMSVVERVFDRLVAFDSTTQGAAQLVFKAHLRTMKVEGLKKILAAGGPALDALTKHVESIRRFQSTEGLSLIDATDELDNYNYTFSGLDTMLLQFGQQIAGSFQMPMVRFFGQSPAGLNATGDSDFRNYYDGINKDQKHRLHSPVTVILDVMCRSEIGRPASGRMTFKFSPLWQMSAKEKAEAAEITARAVMVVEEGAVINRATAMKELRKSSQTTGIFGSISDKDIEAAEQEPPVPAEMDLPEVLEPQIPELDPQGNRVGSGGGGGGGNIYIQDWCSTTTPNCGNFSPSMTTSLTIANAPSGNTNLAVYFDGTRQSALTWTLSGSVVTFSAPIPGNIKVVEIQSGVALTTPGVNSVSNGDGTLNIPTTTGIVTASLNLANANTWTAKQTFNGGGLISGDTTAATTPGAGYIGQTVTALQSSGISLTSGISTNITSMSVSAGHWMCGGTFNINPTSGSINFAEGGVSTASGSFSGPQTIAQSANVQLQFVMPTQFYNFTSTTTVYLVGMGSFTGGATGAGNEYCVRIF